MIKASLDDMPFDAFSIARLHSQVAVDDVDPASDSFRKSDFSRSDRDLVDCRLDDAFFTRLKNGLKDDDADQETKAMAEKFIDDNMSKPFFEVQRERSEFDGPATLGQSLELREDFYAFSYLYQLRRAYLFEQDYYGDDSNCDSEPDSAREQ